MNILQIDEYKTIRVIIKRDELMSDLIREYSSNGWEFLNYSDGIHPEHGEVHYLRFSQQINPNEY